MTMTNTTGEALNRYARHLQACHLSPATIRQYTAWPRLLEQAQGDLLALTTGQIEAWIGEQTWAAWTHLKAVQAVKKFYRWAVDEQLVAVDPACRLRPARTPRPCPDPCPEDLFWRVLGAANGSAYWRLRLAADTGLRRGELARVVPDDVVALPDGPNLRVSGKGGVVRLVPLPFDLAGWLVLQRGPVFPARGGGCQSPDSVGRWYARTLGKHAHSLRHRFACLAYDQDHDLVSLADVMGHASVQTTQRYVATTGQSRRRVASGAWADAA